MRKALSILMCLGMMTVALPMFTMEASAAPWPVDTSGAEDLQSGYSTDFRRPTDGIPQLSNRSAVANVTWLDPDRFMWTESNNYSWWDNDLSDSTDGYLWLQFHDAATGDYGIHRTSIGTSNPVVEHDYYTLRVVVRLGMWDGYNNTAPDNNVYFSFLQSDTQEVWVELGYTRDGVSVTDRFPQTGLHCQLQDVDDGTTSPPTGWNLYGQSLDADSWGSNVRWNRLTSV